MKKTEIEKNIKSTRITTNIWAHEYTTSKHSFYVRTYRFGRRPPEHVQTSELKCYAFARNKKEFIQIIFDIINSK